MNEALARRFDLHGVRDAYANWPALAEDGFRVHVDLPRRTFEEACIVGMGGSASGGDILSGWMAGRGGPNLSVWKGGPQTRSLKDILVIACSVSGETPETVAMMKIAVKAGATVVSMSTGGRLAMVARELGLQHAKMPPTLAPRYLLPFVMFSCLSILNDGLDLRCEKEAEQAIGSMRTEVSKIGLGAEAPSNASKELAQELLGRTPAVYGTTVTQGVGMRFKNVMNENAKIHAYFIPVPEAFHNEIEAWEDPSSNARPVFLRHSADGVKDVERMDYMSGMLNNLGRGPLSITGRGGSSLAQLATMAYRLDMTSYYVAIANGVDPFRTTLMDRLKNR